MVKYIAYTLISLLLVGALVIDYYDDKNIHALRQAAAAEPQPRQRQGGDTLWYEIDSTPYYPSARYLDSLNSLWKSTHSDLAPAIAPSIPTDNVHQPLLQLPAEVRHSLHLPYWSVYRRSFTRWGITFSTGQPNPYNPYPESNALDATVTSHPLNRPK